MHGGWIWNVSGYCTVRALVLSLLGSEGCSDHDLTHHIISKCRFLWHSSSQSLYQQPWAPQHTLSGPGSDLWIGAILSASDPQVLLEDNIRHGPTPIMGSIISAFPAHSHTLRVSMTGCSCVCVCVFVVHQYIICQHIKEKTSARTPALYKTSQPK